MRKTLRTYFIPHEENGYKPHILQKTAVVLMAMMVLMTFTLTNLQALLWMNSSWLIGAILPAVVVEMTNEERDIEHLGTLTRSAVLDKAAQLKAEDMAKRGYFAHYAPDGTSPWHWFNEVSYSYMHAGENLAVHFSDSDEVVEAWMDSPTHRENIMNGKYTEIGVGTARGEYQGFPTVFVVQLFGTPMSGAAPAAVEPEPTRVAVVEIPVEPVPTVAAETTPEPVASTPTEPEIVIVPTPEFVASTDEVVPEEVPALEPIEVSVPVPEEVMAPTPVSEPVAAATADMATEFAMVITEEEPEFKPVSSMARLATQPQRTLNIIYIMTSLFVLGALMASILIEIRKQHPVQIAYGTGLIAAMAALMYVHMAITGGALIA